MIPNPAEGADVDKAARPAASTSVRIVAAVCGTWPGRALAAGLAVKIVALLIRLIAGSEPTWLSRTDTLASLAVLIGAFCFLGTWLARARQTMLWRVRRKLILSYIFIGVVPALLIVSFFVVSGLVVFFNVASYLVTDTFAGLAGDAASIAQATAAEIQRGGGPLTASEVLAHRETVLRSRFPGASMALVTFDAPLACGDAAAPAATSGAAAAAPASVVRKTPLTPAIAVGPWEHVEAPGSLPPWMNCSGFSGLVVYPISDSLQADATGRTSANVMLTLRGVGMPSTERPGYAVVVDIPRNDSLSEYLRDQTSVKVGGASVQVDDRWRTRLATRQRAVRDLLRSSGTSQGEGKQRLPWVAMLQATDWDTGTPVSAAMQIGVNVPDIYDRVSASQVGTYWFVAVFLMIVAGLFLVIEASALVMGLTLARSITGSVHELFQGTERVRAGDFSHRIRVATADQLGQLADSFNQMTGSIETLLREAEEKKRLEEELRIARQIQMSLLPRGKVAVPGLSLTALCVPAREVGGDYYDLLPLDDNRLGVLVADVSGKGTSAALYMAELKGLILSLSRTCRSPRELLLTANEIIADNLDSRSFITMTYAVIDVAARTMTYARAGHTPIIHRRASASGAVPVISTLAPDGLVLGLRIDDGTMFRNLLTEATLPLELDDVLVFFTDGISEAMNPDSDLFGEARLASLVAEHGHLPVEELRERILREIDEFVAGAPQNDDMTMILLKVEAFVPGAIRTGFSDGRA